MNTPAASNSTEWAVLGARIAEARRRFEGQGITQTELGQLLHLHGYRVAPKAGVISRWERGIRPIPQLAKPHLEAVLGIELP